MNTILFKRGQETNIENVTLAEGEIAVAYSADKSHAKLYVGTESGKVCIGKEALSAALSDAKKYADTKISDLVNGAPEAMDTLAELAEAIKANSDIMDALEQAIGGKLTSPQDGAAGQVLRKTADGCEWADGYTHPSTHEASIILEDATHRFVSDNEKTTWNAKLDGNSTLDCGTF